ncbi:hypothetical protein E4U30_008128 [Claviceps sp. LM220 group G6]|nr:hypothetical protein E4U30_008128 [Claviceps sp. LM220 group G6]KAG6107677.1 hypothetical protein E4U31_008233 [Claviceps sp. LM219 group G6]
MTSGGLLDDLTQFRTGPMVNDSRQGDGQREVLLWSSLSSSGSAEMLPFEARTPHVQQIDPKTSRVAVPAVFFAVVSLKMGLYVAEEGFRGDTVLISEGLRPLLPRLELLKSRSQPHLQGHVHKMAPGGNETRAKASPKPHRRKGSDLRDNDMRRWVGVGEEERVQSKST